MSPPAPVSPVYLVGVGQTPFARYPERGHKDLAREALEAALCDAGFAAGAAPLDGAWVGSCAMHAFGQPNLPGQVVLGPLVAEGRIPAGLPIVNVEGACATGALAFQGALRSLQAGQGELVLALGVEKVFLPEDPVKMGAIFAAAMDLLDPETWRSHVAAAAAAAGIEFAPDPRRIVLLDVGAVQARWYLERYGVGPEVLAALASKNHSAGAQNPFAPLAKALSPEEVLAKRAVIAPLTSAMCAPISDGAAALLLASEAGLARLPAAQRARAVPVLASACAGGRLRGLDEEPVSQRAAAAAYAQAGVAPEAIDVAEVHDATAFAELWLSEQLGWCAPGQGAAYLGSGATALGGARPQNPSGGLIAKGHPLAATGIAQLGEVVRQLRGEAGAGQVAGARLGLAHNAGGLIGFDEALAVVTILGAPRG